MNTTTRICVGLALLLGAEQALAQTFLPGDINADHVVNVVDATVLRRALAQLGPGISQTCSVTCGNGVFDPGEQCELGTLGGATCQSLGFTGGVLGCAAGSCQWDTSTCTTPPCDPSNPAPVCGANAHCIPVQSGPGACNSPTGAGGQGSPCSSFAQCAPAYGCLATGSGDSLCLRWCAVAGPNTCGGGLTCVALSPPLFSGPTQYGVCF